MGHNLQYLQYPDAFVDVGHVPPSLRATTKHARMNKKNAPQHESSVKRVDQREEDVSQLCARTSHKTSAKTRQKKKK